MSCLCVPKTALVMVVACVGPMGCKDAVPRCAGRPAAAGATLECQMPGWSDRAFALQVPTGWDGKSALPLVIAFHGGAGNRRSAARVTCPGGEEGHSACLPQVAMAKGFAVVLPDGTGSRLARNIRTWNAGGGSDGFNCTSGLACTSGVDDVRYVREMLGEIRRVIPVDPKRIYATGLSNGAAMSHRMACEMPEEIAAIVAVGGANQHAAGGGACKAPVAVLQIHGTEDPCWTYAQSERTCLGVEKGVKVGVEPSMEGWRTVNGCGVDRVEVPLPDRATHDGTRSHRVSWSGCKAPLELIRIEGGGHTWPGGFAYLGSESIGRVPKDFGSEVIVEFFVAHPKP